ncbi:MAG TPA: hypothetical protein VGK22_06280 [Candidatus Angelobacter sp.]|jgi:hypothetical protein
MSVYATAAFLLGDWALYLETYNEASAQPNSFGVYWIGLSALVFALAAVLQLIKPHLGVKVGLAGCGISCPLVLFALRFSWRLVPRSEYEFRVEGSVAIIVIAIVASALIYKRRVKLHQQPSFH